VTFVDAINVKNNVNNKKKAFSADDHALIKLLRQEKGYGAKKIIVKFSSKPWTLEIKQTVAEDRHLMFFRRPHKSRCNYRLR